MRGEMTIELNAMRFFAFHGMYREEKESGNQFEVNLAVSFYPAGKKIKSLKKTINYEQLFELLKDEMQIPRELLETLAMEIVEKIRLQFQKIKTIRIEIIKLKPPIASFTGNVAVSYFKEF